MWQEDRFVIQRNATAMPRAYVVPRATILPDHPDVVLSALAGLEPRAGVVMTVDLLDGLAAGPRQSFTAAEWTSTDPDRPELFVTTRAPGLLVVADSWMPGWTATVDGRPAPVLRGNYAQRVIPLPDPGRHVIVMLYRAPGLFLGCAMSLVSAMAWLIIVIWRAWARVGARPSTMPAVRGLHPRPAGLMATRRTREQEAQPARILQARYSICRDT
jgi:hypothetical protein